MIPICLFSLPVTCVSTLSGNCAVEARQRRILNLNEAYQAVNGSAALIHLACG